MVKLQKLFADEKFSAAMEVSDVGTIDPQSSGNNSNVEGSEASALLGSINLIIGPKPENFVMIPQAFVT